MPNLYVDVSTIFRKDSGTGIQRVVRALMAQLIAHDGITYRLVPVVATRKHPFRALTLDQWAKGDFDAIRSAHILMPRAYDIFLGLDLSAHLFARHSLQINWLKSCGVHLAVLVYDLLPYQSPGYFTSKNVRHFRRWLSFILVRADRILCISSAVADDVNMALRARLKPKHVRPLVHVIPLGGDIGNSTPTMGVTSDQQALLQRLNTARVILMVGTIEPRKAYDKAVDAIERLWRERPDDDLCLVIVGRLGWRSDALETRLLQHPEHGRRLFRLHDVSDECLDRFYQSCHGLLMASYAEGFGLPVLEALMHDRPVLVRDIAVFREFSDHSGISYFENDDVVSLSADIQQWMEQPRTTISGKNDITWREAGTSLLNAIGLYPA